MPSDRIVVTGATGFIGRQLVERLARDGKALTLAVRDPRKCPAEWRNDPAMEIVAAPDLTRPEALMPLLQRAASVVHLAGLAHVAQADAAGAEAAFMKANAEVTRALADASARSGVPTFVNISSLASVTPNVTEATVDDSANAAPTTAYGRSKRAAEEHVATLAGKGVFAISIRPPLVVGARARGNWGLLQRLAASGIPLPFASVSNQRSFLAVGALCEAISTLVSQAWKAELSGNYCIADAERLSLPEVIAELRRGMGMSPRLFAFRPSVFATIGQLTGRRRQFASLTGNLRVDASRFFSTFASRPGMPIRKAIQESGASYVADRRRSQ
jgi:UDP-glucose 4-epimerase